MIGLRSCRPTRHKSERRGGSGKALAPCRASRRSTSKLASPASSIARGDARIIPAGPGNALPLSHMGMATTETSEPAPPGSFLQTAGRIAMMLAVLLLLYIAYLTVRPVL